MRRNSAPSLLSMMTLLCMLPEGTARLTAQESEPAPAEEKEKKDLQFGGFIDLYYSYNGNSPADRTNFFPGAGVAAKRAEEFALNWAALEIRRDPEPIGFHLIAGTGNALEILHSGEPEGETVGRDALRNVYRASVSYAVSNRLVVEGGIFPSHIGFESALPRDLWNYTGSWAANFSPYYQTGVKAVWSFHDGWSAGVHLVNGWQVISDNNDAKSLGAHLGWVSDRSSVTVNGWAGPELPDDDSSLRTLIDVVATAQVTDALGLAFEGSVGRQEFPHSETAEWIALAGYLRYSFSPTSAVALRAERFDDPDGGISGLSQTIEGGTLTLEHRPHEHLILKLEGRYDRSTEAIFNGKEQGVGEDDQLLFVLGSIVTF